MSFYTASNGNDVIPGFSYFDAAGSLGLGGFNGLDGYDTVDFSGLTTGWIWFEPMLSYGPTVQNTSTSMFFVPPEGRDLYLFATFTSIERIIAGSGDDIIYFTADAIEFEAGGGRDTFIFADPVDFAGGGFNFAEGHIFDGGSGFDTLDLSPDLWPAGYVIDLFLGTGEKFGWPGTTTFTLTSIEIVHGSGGNDVLRPGEATDLLDGGDGDDTFDVNDRFLAAGTTYSGGDGTDLLDFSGETGEFVVDLTLGWFQQTDAPSLLYAHLGGIEDVEAGDGNDTVIGDGERNKLLGGEGDDQIQGNDGNDILKGERGADTLLGNSGRDTLSGQKGRDVLKGGNGNDTLNGGNGNDELSGGKKADLLDGGNGDDNLRGQAGTDTFVFADDHGHDVIRDFKRAELIDLTGVSALADFADVEAAAAEQSGNLLIETGADSSILLRNVALADLDADNFLFA